MAASERSSSKPWATQNTPQDAPVEPLDEEKLQRIYHLLHENGGAVPMGLISQKLPGVKKAHLQEHFELTLFEQGKWEVRLPGSTGGLALYMHGGKAISQPDAIPPLTDEDVQRIAEILQASGGTSTLDDIVGHYPELKKQQLRDLFEVRRRAIPGARVNPEAKRREVYEVSLCPGKEYPGGIVGPPNPELDVVASRGKGKRGGKGSSSGGKGCGAKGGDKGGDKGAAKGAAMAAWASMCQQLWDSWSWSEWSADDSWGDPEQWWQPPAKRQRQGGSIKPLGGADQAASKGNGRISSWADSSGGW